MDQKTLPRSFSKAGTRKAYSRVAWFYDAWGKLTETKAAQRVLELADIRDGEAVLEVAVGTGALFSQIVRRNPSGRNAGIDLSPSMLARVQKRLRGSNAKRVSLQQGEAQNLPFPNASFDLLINCFMLDLLPEPAFEPILQEFRRVLKPNGRLVMATMAFGNKWYHGFWRGLAATFPALLTGCRPVLMQPYLEKTGFANISVEVVSQNTFPAEVLRAEARGSVQDE